MVTIAKGRLGIRHSGALRPATGVDITTLLSYFAAKGVIVADKHYEDGEPAGDVSLATATDVAKFDALLTYFANELYNDIVDDIVGSSNILFYKCECGELVPAVRKNIIPASKRYKLDEGSTDNLDYWLVVCPKCSLKLDEVGTGNGKVTFDAVEEKE